MNIFQSLMDAFRKWRNPSVKVLPPPTPIIPKEPPWLTTARGYLGFREVGVNRGIEKFIALAKCGSIGDPWCAIYVNACLEQNGFPGSRSAMARSFEGAPPKRLGHKDFVKLSGPALGAVTTMWRGSPTAGTGHVFFYLGENAKGIWALGGNQSDQVCKQYEPKNRITGYWWPKSATPPAKIGPITVNEQGQTGGSET